MNLNSGAIQIKKPKPYKKSQKKKSFFGFPLLIYSRSKKNFLKIRISKRCPTHMLPKRVIHVQASFNNTIMTVTYAHGYKSTSIKRTPFATQSAVGNAIQIVVDQEP
ncbi:Ribosomal protein [Trema orientale]|uniref:Ribosomal protein n=1 Tax=Trema orientale TaxID=63057 RepID=A0A2P5FZE6_TREOI|nr:Ribosomal protein [Trema orientale]